MGGSVADGFASCSIGIVMPSIGPDAFLVWTCRAGATAVFLAVFFGTTFFFLSAGFSGIDICMPGIFWCCATAGAETVASASALVAANNKTLTISLQVGGAVRKRRLLSHGCFSYWAGWPPCSPVWPECFASTSLQHLQPSLQQSMPYCSAGAPC